MAIARSLRGVHMNVVLAGFAGVGSGLDFDHVFGVGPVLHRDSAPLGELLYQLDCYHLLYVVEYQQVVRVVYEDLLKYIAHSFVSFHYYFLP